MIRVLFVCLGNICRSPMAEAVFRDLIHKENLEDKIAVDSAGTASWHIGKFPHSGTRVVLNKMNISYKGIKARQIEQKDWEDFNYIIAMDDQNIKDLNREYKTNNTVVVKKLMDFSSDDKESNVPDPYFTGNFDYTYELISDACHHLLSHIRQTHHI